MLIIGELINTSRKGVREAVETQNSEYIRQLAKAQIEAGASITAEAERYHQILPLVQKYKAKVVALCMDDTGIPETAEKRMCVVKNLHQSLTEAGVPEEDIYFDPLVTPVSTGDRAGLEVLETLALISKEYPNVHKVCGLSNVSFGLPNRKVLNQLFLIQTMTMGMDSYILDPLDRVMMGFVHGAQALLGLDSYCANYLSVHRKGLYQSLITSQWSFGATVTVYKHR